MKKSSGAIARNTLLRIGGQGAGQSPKHASSHARGQACQSQQAPGHLLLAGTTAWSPTGLELLRGSDK